LTAFKNALLKQKQLGAIKRVVSRLIIPSVAPHPIFINPQLRTTSDCIPLVCALILERSNFYRFHNKLAKCKFLFSKIPE